MSDNKKQIKDYYAGVDRYNQVEEDAEIRKQGIKGEETFFWGKNAKFGEFTDIRTASIMDYDPVAEVFENKKRLTAYLDVYSGNKSDTPILRLEAEQIDPFDSNTGFLPNTFSLLT